MEISQSAYDEFDYKKVCTLSKEYDVNLWSLHLPFFPFESIEISSCDKTVRDNTVQRMTEIIKRAADTGIDKFIIHPSGEPIDDVRFERLKYAKESLSKLADVCEQNGAVICAENLPRTCLGHSIEEMKKLVADDNRIKICIDTNHITVEKPEDIILALANRIVTVHISDFDFVNERHWLPGEGKIDWKAVLKALGQIEYNGVFLYEIGYKCPETILRDRDLTATDFVKNANELFSGGDITVLSSPKPGLGMWR
jgi:sugar phosphate isomerase/epimerase